MTFSYQCPFVEINEPDLVFCCLYSIGDARIICRFAVFYILFAEFLYPLYIYIFISYCCDIFLMIYVHLFMWIWKATGHCRGEWLCAFS